MPPKKLLRRRHSHLGKLSKSICRKHMEFSICWLIPLPPSSNRDKLLFSGGELINTRPFLTVQWCWSSRWSWWCSHDIIGLGSSCRSSIIKLAGVSKEVLALLEGDFEDDSIIIAIVNILELVNFKGCAV